MHFFYTILIALANNLDNISVRIAYSLRGIRISALMNLWISVITFTIAVLAALGGTKVSSFFSTRISSAISMVILLGIGLWIIKGQLGKKEEDEQEPAETKGKGMLEVLRKPENADMDNSKVIDFKEATMLGIALSLDTVGGGFSAGMMGLNIFFMGFMSALVSFLALWSGNYVSSFLSRFGLGKKAALVSGIALVLLGLKQVL